jgi:N-acetylmuramoyl-L-alanine amidase
VKALSTYKTTTLIICLAAGNFVRCGGQEEAQEAFAEAEAAAQTASADSATLANAIDLYEQFAQRFPTNEHAPKALAMAGRLTQQQGDNAGAIRQYERLLVTYPGSQYGDEAQFMIGFIYEENLGDLESAKEAYQKVIDRYPDSELAASARQLLPHVGKAAEEWVRFQEEVTTQ